MKNSKENNSSADSGQPGVIKRFFILLIYHLLIGHKYTMVAAISLAPLGITLLSITDKYILKENKFLSENFIFLIIFSIGWIPVYIQFSAFLLEQLTKFELKSDWRSMKADNKFKLKLNLFS